MEHDLQSPSQAIRISLGRKPPFLTAKPQGRGVEINSILPGLERVRASRTHHSDSTECLMATYMSRYQILNTYYILSYVMNQYIICTHCRLYVPYSCICEVVILMNLPTDLPDRRKVLRLVLGRHPPSSTFPFSIAQTQSEAFGFGLTWNAEHHGNRQS